MSSYEISKEYKVTFNKPEYNAVYKFVRTQSGAFDYGNGSCVVVFRNGEYKDTYDTRYDKIVMKDFSAWCNQYLATAFNKDYEPHYTEI